MRPARNVEVPEEFALALKADPKALAAFEAMPPSHQREYVGAIVEAKKPETKQRRIESAISMIRKWGEQREARKRRA
jgi:uncharacterized protein YdeI (YjbR/CyaY-like superfamily)